MATPKPIIELIDRFDRNKEAYQSGQYNETQLRREFLDPFFESLGWDIYNKQGYAEAYKDVIHEDAIKIGAATKAPDYCFRIGGTRKFFVEAKKPAVNVKEDISPAFQLRRYSWSAKLPLSILTDFEEFAVYDCRIKPIKTDHAATARIKYLTYTDYLNNWDELVSIFSREAVLKGSFDKYIETTKIKKGTAEVDDAFLTEIEIWRDNLARNIALRNPNLSQRELNFAVQRTIDRLIFLRICEDRGIEEYGRLMMLQNSDRVYPKLCDLFHRADERYNSGLFHFSKEKDRAESPDQLTLNIAIDDKPLKEIIKNLYYPDSAYEFAVLPADILGQVYEQFLGKVIRLTTGHRAVVEDKPEVKKAGGVYYTPTYIVDYIVKNTVGKLLENKTPKSVVQLRILDPACGSGSFLINAYQLLLDWHRDYYINEGIDKHKKELYQVAGGDYRLTTAERKRILLNNIYGVDIDPQAVEVTKLSLLLKVLEGENEQTISNQLRLFHERALPDLGNNIKCGNSLIGPDFYDNQQLNFLDDDERYRINVFDWQKEFPTIFSHENTKSTKSNPGFDAVIGNPPWGSFISDMEKKYLYEKYVNRRGEAESHLFFMEQGLKLLNKTGILGYITPNTWLSVLNSNEIRAYLLKNAAFYEITELTKYIFKDAPDIVPIVIFLGKKQANEILCMVKRTNVIKVHAGNFYDVFSIQEIPTKVWLNTPGTIINLHATTTVLRIIDRCKANSIALSAVCDVLYGIKTSDNEKYLSNIKTKTHNVKALKTGELVRFNIKWKGIYLWWCPELAGYRKSSLEIPKIVVQYIRKLSLSKRIIAALDEKGIYYPLNNYSYIAQKDLSYSLKYILGLLNSSLLNYYFANTFIDYNIKPTYLQQLPIKPIDFSDPKDKSKHDRMVELVDRMLTLHKQLASTKTPDERTALQRHIDATDSQIDRLVYELYGLTEEEIKIVEGINNV